jgi:hypothetical protein
MYLHISFYKNMLGFILGYFFTNSSGRPVPDPGSRDKESEDYLKEKLKLSEKQRNPLSRHTA